MEKILIRKVEEKDADFLFQIMNNETIMTRLNEVATSKEDWIEAINQ